MPFSSDHFETLLPSYLTQAQKDRLKEALSQFKIAVEASTPSATGWAPSFYHSFYVKEKPDYFMQGDLIREIRMPLWDSSVDLYDKIYPNAIIISNTCDIDFSNAASRSIPKMVLFAPMIPLKDYLEELQQEGSNKNIAQVEKNIKDQQLSNVFYLPADPVDQVEYIVQLDQLAWFPAEELKEYLTDINQNRIASLALFGYYLFMLKLSYHLCRLPEDNHRAEVEPD